MKGAQPNTYKIELVPMKSNAHPDASFQRLLKAAKRGYQFHCVNFAMPKPVSPESDVKAQTNAKK
jgi:hypothetical protein